MHDNLRPPETLKIPEISDTTPAPTDFIQSLYDHAGDPLETTAQESQKDPQTEQLREQFHTNIGRYEELLNKYDEYENMRMKRLFSKENNEYDTCLQACQSQHDAIVRLHNTYPLPEKNYSEELYNTHEATHVQFCQALTETEKVLQLMEAKIEQVKAYQEARQMIQDTLLALQETQDTAVKNIRNSDSPASRENILLTFKNEVESFLHDSTKMAGIRSLEEIVALVNENWSHILQKDLKGFNKWPQSIQVAIDRKMFNYKTLAEQYIIFAPDVWNPNRHYIHEFLQPIIQTTDDRLAQLLT